MGYDSDYSMGDQCPVRHASDDTDPSDRADHACRFTSEQLGPVRTVKVVGYLDWATADEFGHVIDEDLMGSPVIIDLTLAGLDSAGTGRLVAAALRSKEHSQPMVVVATDPAQLEVFHAVGLADIVAVVHSMDEALQELDTIDLAGSHPC